MSSPVGASEPTRRRRAGRDGPSVRERGAVAGAESLAIGALVLIGGLLLVVNAWCVVDARLALDAAAREYLRAYTQATGPAEAATEGRAALDDVLVDRPRLAGSLSLVSPEASSFGPCSPAVVELHADVPAMHMPFIGDLGTRTVSVRHVELVDAHREFESLGGSYQISQTACGG